MAERCAVIGIGQTKYSRRRDDLLRRIAATPSLNEPSPQPDAVKALQ